MTRTFKLFREEDVSGVSGTGAVVEGALFSDGHAVIHWTGSPHPTTTPHPEGLSSVMYVHGHQGKTRLVWDNDQPAPGFSEEDIAFIHEILCMPGETISHERARKLLGKIRAAMTDQTVP
jgi:hypothetical protein